MKLTTLFCSAMLALAATFANATPFSTNASDLWWDPIESGWGLNVIHQGDTLFATMFVYGNNGQSKWFVASDLASSGDGPLHDRPLVFEGGLYEVIGSYFGAPFDPAAVSRRQVGTMRFEMVELNAVNLTYTVDGVLVTKRLQRSSFRASDLSGSYVGHQNQPASSPGGAVNDEMTITINQSGSAISMQTQGSASGACNYSGSFSPFGQLSRVEGSYSCADARSGTFEMLDIDVSGEGLTARFRGNRIQDTFFGRMGGVRTSATGLPRGNGFRTDLWWVPSESGWGLNLIEQGDTLFGTMFVYDTLGQPRWYVASAMTAAGTSGSGNTVHTGTLYEATGPYFGTGFDPNLVNRRAVGTIAFELRADGTALLTYNVDSVAVAKTVSRVTFRDNNLSGTYVGHQAAAANDRGGVRSEPMTIAVNDNGSSVTITTQSAASGSCTYSAPRVQTGQKLAIASGTYTCANGSTGTFSMSNIEVTFSGFAGQFRGNGIEAGRMGGVRTGVH